MPFFGASFFYPSRGDRPSWRIVFFVGLLCYSQDESYPRVAAARLVRKFPLTLQMLRDGALTLSTLRMIGHHLTETNAHERLAAAARLTVKKVEELIAAWAPKDDVPTTVKFIAPAEQPRLLQRMEAAASPTPTGRPQANA